MSPCHISCGAVFFIAFLHLVFMFLELFPWERPYMMPIVLRTWKPKLNLDPDESHLVAMIVHNAGVVQWDCCGRFGCDNND